MKLAKRGSHGAKTQRILPVLLILLNLSLPQTLMAQWFEDEQAIMGTPLRVELWSDDAARASAAMAAVMHEMHRIDALMGPFKTNSELARINREAGKNTAL